MGEEGGGEIYITRWRWNFSKRFLEMKWREAGRRRVGTLGRDCEKGSEQMKGGAANGHGWRDGVGNKLKFETCDPWGGASTPPRPTLSSPQAGTRNEGCCVSHNKY